MDILKPIFKVFFLKKTYIQKAPLVIQKLHSTEEGLQSAVIAGKCISYKGSQNIEVEVFRSGTVPRSTAVYLWTSQKFLMSRNAMGETPLEHLLACQGCLQVFSEHPRESRSMSNKLVFE